MFLRSFFFGNRGKDSMMQSPVGVEMLSERLFIGSPCQELSSREQTCGSVSSDKSFLLEHDVLTTACFSSSFRSWRACRLPFFAVEHWCLSGSFSTPYHPFRPKPAEHFSEPQSMVVIIAVVA
jgi:hypothetical protein